MIRTVLIIIACCISTQLIAQKPQKVGYIDMEYILENVPEYAEAQAKLEERSKHWQRKLDDIKREIEVLKTDLANEKALLTKELIQEREEDIEIKELDLRNLQATYFGPNGDIYFLRRQLVKPIQDQVYNAVQEIAVRKKYDMILDKSSDLIVLYTNKKFDESETILNRIVKNRKVKALKEKRAEKLINNKPATLETTAKETTASDTSVSNNETIETDSIVVKKETVDNEKKKTIDAKQAKRDALKEKARLVKEAQEKRRQEYIKVKEEKRKKRLEEIEKRKKQQNNTKEQKTNN